MSFDRGPDEALATITDYLRKRDDYSLVLEFRRGKWSAEIGDWDYSDFNRQMAGEHEILAGALYILADKVRRWNEHS